MTRKISTTVVPYSKQYPQYLAPDAQIGQVAAYLSQVETQVDSHTLEIAIPVRMGQYIGDIGIESGDRLLIFMQAPKIGHLPPPLRVGDKILRFESSSGDISVHSHGKRELLIGKPDDARQLIPDVDLRYFVPHRYLDSIAHSTLMLRFDLELNNWVAMCMGTTGVMIDEADLHNEQFPLNQSQTLRFFAPDDPYHNYPLAEMLIRSERVQADSDWTQIQVGNELVTIRVGWEREKQLLNVSDNVRITQILNGLARYNRLMLNDHVQVFLLRLIAPEQALQILRRYPDGFLYAPIRETYSQTVLHLRDIQDASRVYSLYVGQDDEEKSIGFRLSQTATNPSLDLDLYAALLQRGHDPHLFDTNSPYQAWLLYRGDEHSWWLRLDEDACIPVYINNTRLTVNLHPLMAGDVLTFGPGLTNYYVRLVADMGENDTL